jgi:hypothetical protein
MARRHLHFLTKAASVVLRSGLPFIRASIGSASVAASPDMAANLFGTRPYDQELLSIACAAVRLAQSFIAAAQ